MTKNKVIHARIDDDTHEKLFEKCNELGCTFTDYIQSVVSESLDDDEPSESELNKTDEPHPQVIEIKDVRPKVFDCSDGNLFVDGKFYGKCSDYEMTDGKIFDSSGNHLGQTRDSLKPTVTLIE